MSGEDPWRASLIQGRRDGLTIHKISTSRATGLVIAEMQNNHMALLDGERTAQLQSTMALNAETFSTAGLKLAPGLGLRVL